MNAFDNLVDYIAAWETFSATPYYATEDEKKRNILTIGYGFAYLASDCPTSMTKEQAIFKLNYCLDVITAHLQTYFRAFPKQQMIDAVISLSFNMGIDAFPKLIALASSGHYEEAYEQLFDCIYQSKKPLLGLIYRRACDAQIFKNGKYERREWITPDEKALFLKMNANNQDAIDMINNRVKVQ